MTDRDRLAQMIHDASKCDCGAYLFGDVWGYLDIADEILADGWVRVSGNVRDHDHPCEHGHTSFHFGDAEKLGEGRWVATPCPGGRLLGNDT